MSAANAITYKVSALLCGLIVAARGWRVVVPVTLINALLQAALISPGIHPEISLGFIALALISYAALVFSFVLVVQELLRVIAGNPHMGLLACIKGAASRFIPVLLWSLACLVLITIGLALYVFPGLVVIALIPFLLMAAVDAQPNPVKVNFKVLKHRFWRWLLTVVIMGIMCGVLWLLATVNAFFIAGPLGALIAWLAYGLIATWFIAAWALIYRSVISTEVHARLSA